MIWVKVCSELGKIYKSQWLIREHYQEEEKRIDIDISNPETMLARIIYTEHMYKRPRPQVDVDNISLNWIRIMTVI